jgi:hypothetical protein
MSRQGGTLSGCCAKAGLLLLLGSIISGCSNNGRERATVSGTVSYKGKPLPAGKVSFWGPNDQVASALIGEDGSYEATDVPVGLVKVAVSTPPPPPPEIEKAAKEGKRRFGKGKLITAAVNIIVIPVKYSDPAKSGLSLTVTEGSQPFSIELK